MKVLLGVATIAAILLISACRDNGLAPINTPPQNLSQTMVIDTGYIMREGTPVRVVFEILNGRAIFEGDIDLGPEKNVARTLDELLNQPQRSEAGVVRTDGRWGSGVVPYVFESGFPLTQLAQNALSHISSRVAGMQFRQRTTENDYITFRVTSDTTICGQSVIGRQGGNQSVWIRNVPVCTDKIGVLVHEIGHAIGFWHEQSRCDRDSYVQILFDSILPGRSDQFTKMCSYFFNAEDLESYDEGSVMHYGKNAFGITSAPGHQAQTILSLRGLEDLMGQRDSLSTTDIFTVNRMYQPYARNPVTVTNDGDRARISWPGSPRATYSVWLVRTYDEWNDYAGTHYTYDDYLYAIGTPDSTTLDMQQTWTGNYICQLWSNINGSASYSYYYEVYSDFANGVSSPASYRAPAPISPSSPPCPDYITG